MRSPVTDVIERYNALTDEQKKLCLDFIDPQPEPEAPKKTRRPRTTRSARASLSAAISKTPKAGRSADPCIYQYPKDSTVNAGMVCGEFFENGIHDETMRYAGYHPFVPPASSAGKRSSRKGAATNSTTNTEVETESVSAVGASGD